jgi:hypothetical protein
MKWTTHARSPAVKQCREVARGNDSGLRDKMHTRPLRMPPQLRCPWRSQHGTRHHVLSPSCSRTARVTFTLRGLRETQVWLGVKTERARAVTL